MADNEATHGGGTRRNGDNQQFLEDGRRIDQLQPEELRNVLRLTLSAHRSAQRQLDRLQDRLERRESQLEQKEQVTSDLTDRLRGMHSFAMSKDEDIEDLKVQLMEMEEKFKETKSIYKRKVKHLARVQESLRKLRKEVKEAEERRSKQRERERLFSSSFLGRLMVRCGIRKEAPPNDDDEDSDGGGGNPAPTKKQRLNGCSSNADGATTDVKTYGSSTSSDDDDDDDNGQDLY